MPFVTRDEVKIFFEDDGAGTPILLTHGFAAAASMWDGQVATFKDRFRLIRWDMRGHGHSDAPTDVSSYSQPLTVDDMATILDHLEVQEAIIGGHSLGGFMSLAFHAKYPDRVKALYLQGCGPGYRSNSARARWNERAASRARTIEEGGLRAVGGASEVASSTRSTPQGLANAARGILSQVDATVINSLPCVSVPTLILIGANDSPYLDGASYMAKRIPNAQYIVVDDAGHGVNIDQPSIVNAALDEFFSSVN